MESQHRGADNKQAGPCSEGKPAARAGTVSEDAGGNAEREGSSHHGDKDAAHADRGGVAGACRQEEGGKKDTLPCLAQQAGGVEGEMDEGRGPLQVAVPLGLDDFVLDHRRLLSRSTAVVRRYPHATVSRGRRES